MSRLNLLAEGKSYTFRSYFEMPYEIDEILAEFGVGFNSEELPLPRAEIALSIAEPMSQELGGRLRRVRLSSKTARREALVSPILFSVAEISDSQLWVFGRLDVQQQTVIQALSRYRVPENVYEVMEILTGILTTDQLATA